MLAPMEDVTDTVFREIVLSVSSPQILKVLFTEFTSTDGLCHEKGRSKTLERLLISDSERNILKSSNIKLVAQIWGSNPENFYQGAKLISELGEFDGIDINMGCPVKKIVNNKSCSALINFPSLAKEIIIATQNGTNLPVSVKTRLGFKSVITEEWIGHLLETNLHALTIHGRTQKMMSTGEVMWDEIGKAVQMRNKLNCETIIIGNGEIISYTDALLKAQQYGVDGIMAGTGIFKNPWLFNNPQFEISIEDKISLLEKHVQLFESTWKNNKNFNVLKRFFKIYLNGFPGAVVVREKLMNTNSCQEALEQIKKIRNELLQMNLIKCDYV
jgi:tRNA-dihydrouridine synthase